MELTTTEKFLLLAHHPRKKRFVSPFNYIKLGYAACVYMELALLDKISIKKRRIFVKRNDVEVKHPFLKELLEEVSNKKNPKVLKSRLLSIYRKRSSKLWEHLEEMEGKSLVRVEHKRFLGLFPYRKSVLTNTLAQQILISEYRTKLKYLDDLDNEDRGLIGLIDVCKLYPTICRKKKERKEFEKNAKEIVQNWPVKESIGDAVNQVCKITTATMFLTVYYVYGRSTV
nr:GPP34 family phosphoprotein [uncultured Brumimicrobium sp.]